VILRPLVAGLEFGKNCCAGLLSGFLTFSVQLAVRMGNPGIAWDNSNKHISASGLGEEFVKSSNAHKNSVTGDTVGDPLKKFVKGSEAHKNPVSGETVGDPLKAHKNSVTGDTVGNPTR